MAPVGAVPGAVAVGIALAAARLAGVTTKPLLELELRNALAVGWWMLAMAAPTLAPWLALRKPTDAGGAITMPIPAATRSIRWSSASDATLVCSCSLRSASSELRCTARPMLAPSLSTSTCIATIPASITPSARIHARPRTSRSITA